MKKTLMAIGTMAMLGSTANAQKVAFEEFDLDHKNAFGAQRGARGATGRNTQMTLRPY
jgi:hypothetical protein